MQTLGTVLVIISIMFLIVGLSIRDTRKIPMITLALLILAVGIVLILVGIVSKRHSKNWPIESETTSTSFKAKRRVIPPKIAFLGSQEPDSPAGPSAGESEEAPVEAAERSAAPILAATSTVPAQRVDVCLWPAVCTPPATFTSLNSPVPFNAPVRFSHSEGNKGVRSSEMWVWIKTAEPPRPCNAADRAKGPEYQRACNTPIGQPFYYTRPFRIIE
jgi:hypothetical protein